METTWETIPPLPTFITYLMPIITVHADTHRIYFKLCSTYMHIPLSYLSISVYICHQLIRTIIQFNFLITIMPQFMNIHYKLNMYSAITLIIEKLAIVSYLSIGVLGNLWLTVPLIQQHLHLF